MIRIQTANNPRGVTIAIDGQLIGEYVEEVEASIRNAIEQYKIEHHKIEHHNIEQHNIEQHNIEQHNIEQHNDVHLFLRDVSQIDETGHALLSRLGAQGVVLSAAGLYSSYVVTEIQHALRSRQSRGK